MNFIIVLCICASYYFGAKAILENKYKPNLYSRVIWLILAINGTISVILLQNASSVIWLALLGLVGNIVIFSLALKKSQRIFGPIEKISTILLIVSMLLWILLRSPILNLTIVLLVTFIGGIPTYLGAMKDPKSEELLFWLFFALGSLISLIYTDHTSIVEYLYPLFFFVVNTGVTALCLRRYL